MTDARHHRATFFRQSGWLMFANIAGGMMMWAVDFLNKFIEEGEYGSFGALLAVVMLLPTIPLQMVIAQQTAQAVAINAPRKATGAVQLVLAVTFVLWLAGAILVLLFQDRILARWQMTNPLGLWITLPIVLLTLWMPVFWGVLQGQQNFFWLGWSAMSSGLGRIVIAAVAVLLLNGSSAGMMAGVLFGVALAAGIAAWHTRSVWLMKAEAFDWRALASEMLPLGLGFLGFQVLLTADTILVKGYFEKSIVDFYVSAGTLSRALMWLVLPLASVMFPRIVHSAAKSEKTDLMKWVLLGTGLLALTGVVGLAVLGPWVVRIIYKPEYVEVASAVLPWYAGAMVPLAMANVLLNNLFASPRSKWAPAVCIFGLAAAYIFAVTQYHDSLLTVLRVLGVFSLALLVCAVWFTWG
ncbi:MAG TPA: lipid II flippase MurJ, partial [Verrucomicrobiota bacterium]|nr:lipid II flippase MurJ [Verrucomicrobiota bacterium]